MRLGEMLIARRLLSPEELDRGLELQKDRGEKIGKILVDLGFLGAKDLMNVLSEQLQVPLVAIDGPPLSIPETEALAPRFLRQFRVLPIGMVDSSLRLAMADPLDVETIRAVESVTGLKVQTALA